MVGAVKKTFRRGTIGVSIEIDAIHLSESYGGRIFRHASMGYPADMPQGAEQLSTFLHDALRTFCPGFRQHAIWAVGSLSNLHVRYMTLPAVRSGSFSDMVYWAFRNEIPFNTTETIFDYSIEGGSSKDQEDKVHVTAYTALRSDVDVIVRLFAAARIDLAGIVIPSFAMRNMMRLQMDGQATTRLGLFVGEESSTVLVVRAGRVHSSRVFKTGMNALLAAVSEKHPEASKSTAYRMLQKTLHEEPDGAIARRVNAVFDRLILQIERTMAADLSEHPDERFDGLHVMGAIAGLPQLVSALKTSLGLSVSAVSNGQGDSPEQAALASGAALSRPDRTPNLLRTHVERERSVRQSRRSFMVALGLALLLLLLHGGVGALEYHNTRLRERVSQAQQKLAVFPDVLEESLLAEMMDQVVEARLQQKRLALRWLPLGGLRGLADLTPPTIRLTAIDATFPRRQNMAAEGVAAGRRQQPAQEGAVFRIRGRVADEPEHQRSALASYTVRLENSPLYEKAEVLRVTQRQDRTVLDFELRLTCAAIRGDGAAISGGGAR